MWSFTVKWNEQILIFPRAPYILTILSVLNVASALTKYRSHVEIIFYNLSFL